jgi:SAM-dependent methyltransferase
VQFSLGNIQVRVSRSRPTNRSDYKGTWSAISKTEHDALVAVAGEGQIDEGALSKSAAETLRVLQQYVGIRDTDDVLEIGCGVGRVGRVIAPICRSWTGTDISAGMLVAARSRLADLPNVRLVELSSVGLTEFADASFDFVYCTVVFMHLFEWDRYKYIEEALRVLRPGGRIFFDNIDIRSSYGRSFFANSAKYPVNARPPHIAMVSSGDELQSYGEWAGFTDVQIHRWDDAWVALTGTKA